MRKLIIWLSAITSIGLHFGLLTLLSQAQAMPKQPQPAPANTLSVTFTEGSMPVAVTPLPQPPQAKPALMANQPHVAKKPTAQPTAAKASQTAKATRVQATKAHAEASRPNPAKFHDHSASKAFNSASFQTRPSAGDTQATGASDKPPKSTARPEDAVPASYPPRYRGPQPAPDYPRMARRRGLEGSCLIEVLMDTRGDVITLALKQSTGHSVLDQAALAAVKSWKFIAPSGMTGATKALVPVRFNLT